jgi:hypothetical protein
MESGRFSVEVPYSKLSKTNMLYVLAGKDLRGLKTLPAV